ncbi:MAG: hypothetical protein J7J89_02640 [Thermoplasmata archaeon]|nr:hypothetical protein [Thermoplasmata archaeon]RLF60487.1 MAG: hypothetical protein DRN16_04710 [Thermoplasmata archaeon]
MNVEGHKNKAKELERSLSRLLPDPEGENVVAIVELTYGILLHLIAAGMETKYGRHLDTHAGLPRELRKAGEVDIAEIFEMLDTFRAGRWYGSKGDGEIVEKCLDLIRKVKEWAVENDDR